jgi:hypothetical protein
MRTQLLLAIALSVPVFRQDSGTPRAGAAFVERHTCEGKCCSLRMAVQGPIPVFAAAGAPATIVAWLAPGDTVLADIDLLRWSRVGAIVILRRYEYFDEYNSVTLSLTAGDTIPLLSYFGEGRYEIWHQNAKRLVLLFWNDGRSFPPLANPPARELYYSEPTLWLRMKVPKAASGWIARSGKLRQVGQRCS